MQTTVDFDSGLGRAGPGAVGAALPDGAPAPRVLGDFTLGEVLGKGGFGTVYRAEQLTLGRPSVVKVIRRSLITHREAAERFTREAQLAARFEHPYAAHIYAFGIEPDGMMWIAMEFVNGTPLGELVAQSGALPLDRFVPFFERLCEAVQAAHDQGIVHRDIKPSNVMVATRGGRLIPKLLDFGIAKHSASEPARRAGIAEPTGGASAAEPAEGTGPISVALGLTHDGQILGSPAYMAPEQWRDAAAAGPAADQYSLALLAYEALAGVPAFSGNSIEALEHQHLHAPLPAIPGYLPVSVHKVLARGSAKAPADRYPAVTAFASALRAAALGTSGELDERRATLPADLATRWISLAPRPLAEAVAALGQLSSASRITERVHEIGSLVARWLGVLAIACRSKLGRLEGGDSTEAGLLIALRRRPLLDGEWLDLAAALVRPWLRRPEMWPVPEMARFLASDAVCARLRGLLRDPAAIAADPASGAVLDVRLAELAAVLGELGWMCSYAVAREIPGGLELYQGTRSDDKLVRVAPSRGNDELVVLDADGARIAQLSPLALAAAPMPGEPRELFFLVGPGRSEATARFASYPHGFEHEDEVVWHWLAEHVLDAGPSAAAPLDDERSPYPGLASYTASDWASFVGREQEVEEVVNRLRAQSLVAIVGPSGTGKTSFLAAGLGPALRPAWQAVIVRPGSDPVAALASLAVARDAPPYRAEPGVPTADAHALAAGLVFAASRSGGLALLVDQAEELFTMASAEARAVFAEALVHAAADPRIRVVIALRDDFLCRGDEIPAWRGLLGASVQVLRTPSRDDLERILTVPARRRGYELDDPRLPGEIASEVEGRPGALPLLAFAAAELWERRDRHFRRLTRAVYDQIGGVTGALVQHADGVVDRMPASERRLVRVAFRRLLTSEGARAIVTRVELECALGGPPGAAAVIDRLFTARLIVSRDDDPADRIEVIHETLATAWPRLAAWRREDAEAARLQDQLAAAARSWDARGRPADLLWRGAALADLARWHGVEDRGLSAVEHAFVRASLWAESRSRRRRIRVLGSAFALLVAGILGLVSANLTVARQRAATVDRLADSYAERGRLAVGDGDYTRAMLYLAEASKLGARGPGFDVLASRASLPFEAGWRILGHVGVGILALDRGTRATLVRGADTRLWRLDHGVARAIAQDVYCEAPLGDLALTVSSTGQLGAVDATGARRWQVDGVVSDLTAPCGVLPSPTGELVVTFGPRARLWQPSTGAPRGDLAGGEVTAAAWNARGTLVATGDAAGVVRVWRSADASLAATCESHGAAVRALTFAPGDRVVSGGAEGDVRVCDAATGATVYRLIGHSGTVLAVDVSPDGSAIVSAGRDGKPRIWDARSGALTAVLGGHDGAVLTAAYASDGNRILTLGMDGAARLWDRAGAALAVLPGHGTPILAGGWEDPRHVITASFDGTIQEWDVDRAIEAMMVRAHDGELRDLALSSNDRWLLSGGEDHLAILWDRRSGRPIARLAAAADVTHVALGPHDAEALVIDHSSTAGLWTVPEGRPIATLPHTTAGVFMKDGTLITAGDGRIVFRAADGAERGVVPCRYDAVDLRLDPSGRWLAVVGITGSLEVVDVARRQIAVQLPLHDKSFLAVALDAARIAVADGAHVRLWQLGSWLPLGELVGHKGMLNDLWFLPDGRLVSAAFDGTFVWQGSRLLAKLADIHQVYGLAVAPGGALFATTATDGSVHVWDGTTYRSLLRLPSHRTAGAKVAFSRDGASVISGGFDGQIAIWNLPQRTRSTAELADIVRCRVPLRLEGDIVLPRDLDFDDPTCQMLAVDRAR